jgi:FtsH-binding integral membrane protein
MIARLQGRANRTGATMSYFDHNSNTRRSPLGMGAPPYVGPQVDEGLRAYMQRVYSYIQRMSAGTAMLLFWLYAAVMGLSLGGIFLVYTGTSIARVFFITAATYGAMSLYGYTTKTDLSGFGSFLLMGLIGIVIASLVNLFIGSNTLQFVISIIGVIVFVGLTAYDTQRIKEMYLESDTAEVADKKAVLGALALYLDFINLFMMLLQLFGQRREN